MRFLIGITTALLLAVAACATASDSPDLAEVTDVNVTLGEWFVTPVEKEVQSGVVRLTVRNVGTLVHEVEVIRKIDEFQEYEIGELEDIASGDVAVIELPVSAGRYELACTIVQEEDDGRVYNHYRLGMFDFITVSDS